MTCFRNDNTDPKESPMSTMCELTILMPCLNEAKTLATCIAKAKGFLAAPGSGASRLAVVPLTGI